MSLTGVGGRSEAPRYRSPRATPLPSPDRRPPCLGLPTVPHEAGRPVSMAQITRPAMCVFGMLILSRSELSNKPARVLLYYSVLILFCAFETILSIRNHDWLGLHVLVLSNTMAYIYTQALYRHVSTAANSLRTYNIKVCLSEAQ